MTQINILIVDDNKIFTSQCSKYISTVENFNVVGIANDGIEAIEFIKNTKIDVIILDIIMPQINGIGVVKFVNELHSFKPHIIITSEVNSKILISDLYNDGIVDYMLKPFLMEQLVNRILDLIKNNTIHMPKTIETEIIKKLHDLGVQTNCKGYLYIKMAIAIILRQGMDNVMISTIYNELSEKYNCSEISIEKAIRDCIDITFNNERKDELNRLFKHCISKSYGKVSNKKFLYEVAYDLVFNIRSFKSS